MRVPSNWPNEWESVINKAATDLAFVKALRACGIEETRELRNIANEARYMYQAAMQALSDVGSHTNINKPR